jgi:putative transposase
MVLGLERHQRTGHLHFVTFSCYQRLAYLSTPILRDSFENALQRVRLQHHIEVIGYVVMPEHVHLLLSEPARELLAVGLQALKLSVVRRARQRPFWQARYYDFNVFTKASVSRNSITFIGIR